MPDPHHPLRQLRPGAGARRPACRWCCPKTACPTAPATRCSSATTSINVACPCCGKPAQARNRHHGHLRGFVLVLHALLRPVSNDRHDGGRGHRLLDADGPVHRRHRARHPAPAVRALLDQGDARPGPGRRSTSPSRTCSPRAWCSTTSTSHKPEGGGKNYFWRSEVDIQLRCQAARSSAPRSRADGTVLGARGREHHVQVQEQRRGPAGPDRAVRRRHRPLLHDVRRAARADAGVERRRRWKARYRFLKRVWNFGHLFDTETGPQIGGRARAARRQAGRAPWPRRCAARSTCCSSRSTTTLGKQQFNTVASGHHEDAQRPREGPARRRAWLPR